MKKIKTLGHKLLTHLWKHKWRYILLVLIIGGIWWRLARPKEDKQEEVTQTLIPVRRESIQETIDVSGTISSANYTTVQTQAIGTVTQIYVEEGQTVKEGDKMFELELTPEGKQANQSAYSSYLSAKNSLNSAQNQLNSLQVTLFDKNKYFIEHADKEDLAHENPDWIMQWADWLAAEGSYKNQEQAIKQAQANVASAYQTYRNTGATVYAPVSGTVENITAVEGLSFGSVSSGAGISLSARLATIKTGEQVLAIFTASASDIIKIELGQKVKLTGTNLPVSYTGEVVSVDRYGTTGTTTTYQVIARFDTQSNEQTEYLLPNLSVDGEIMISQVDDALVVPTLAITKTGDHSSVTVRDDLGNDTVREITTGVVSGNLTQVTDGLQEGDQVVLSLNEFSSDGQMRVMMGGAHRDGDGGNPPPRRD